MCFSDIPAKRLERNIKKRYARYDFGISELFDDTSGEPRIRRRKTWILSRCSRS